MIKRAKLVVFYILGNVVARLFYPRHLLQSKYYLKIGSKGWRWVVHCFFWQKIMRINNHVPWPVSFKVQVVSPQNIDFHLDDLHNFMTSGLYLQANDAKLVLGKGTYIAPNVGIVTQNHDLLDLSKRTGGKDIVIGERCWLGMNSVILPGVTLGESTIVAAGAVVTKSFTEGFCVLAGSPARIIKHLK